MVLGLGLGVMGMRAAAHLRAPLGRPLESGAAAAVLTLSPRPRRSLVPLSDAFLPRPLPTECHTPVHAGNIPHAAKSVQVGAVAQLMPRPPLLHLQPEHAFMSQPRSPWSHLLEEGAAVTHVGSGEVAIAAQHAIHARLLLVPIIDGRSVPLRQQSKARQGTGFRTQSRAQPHGFVAIGTSNRDVSQGQHPTSGTLLPCLACSHSSSGDWNTCNDGCMPCFVSRATRGAVNSARHLSTRQSMALKLTLPSSSTPAASIAVS